MGEQGATRPPVHPPDPDTKTATESASDDAPPVPSTGWPGRQRDKARETRPTVSSLSSCTATRHV
ncbi:hypothetical protein ColTof4_11494 [Colletotrichum tofieldiae]|nr:hypothetical protein ColTof3_04682 [Colletotrichum tofieldiae]GKT79071.1 hypothetical protein ColTof4_11494 [Colletotrichum tofieldiae]